MSAVLDFAVKPEARPYLDAFRSVASEPQWLRKARRAALDRFGEVGFPGRRNEAWRYIDLQPLERTPLLPSLTCISPEFSGDRTALPPGVWFGSVRSARAERPELLARLSDGPAGDAPHPLAALNEAFFAAGYILDVAHGVVVDKPIEIAHAASPGSSFHTRSLINLGQGSRVAIVETYAGEGRYWRNDVLHVRVADGAALTRSIVVDEDADAFHTALFDAVLADRAELAEFVLLLGGSRVRHEAQVRLAGEGARCEIDGAYVVAGNDEANIVTAIDHAAPGGRTRELIKGVAAERGHGAFQGKIVVRKHAQKTDAHQLSRNLIIGRRAVIDTKPELEIEADDVKCAHGASVGDLDEAALFYLRARGIPADEARRILIEGFLREAVETVADAGVRDYLLRRLAARLEKLEG